MPLMITRRHALLMGFSLAAFQAGSGIAKAQLTASDRAELARIEAYLNGIRSMKAHFIQTAPDGGISQGEAMMLRPGRMRFQYDPPSPFLLVANYGILFFHDSQLNQTSNIPLSRTPLGILLANRTTLSGDVTVTRFVHLPGQILVSLVRTADPGEGTLTLSFADNPLTLRQWTVMDAQGKQTRVSLLHLDVGVHLSPSLFDYHGEVPGTGGASGG
jgi:outer membrane lipoprotein-sorting protein